MIAFKNEALNGLKSRCSARNSAIATIRLRQGYGVTPIAFISVLKHRALATENKAGFTLIEVLLALAIIGLILSPIFMLQSNVLQSSSARSRLFSYILEAKKFLLENEFGLSKEADESRNEKKITNPPGTLIYELKKVSQESPLKKFKNLSAQTVTMQWIDRQGKRQQDKLVTFLYRRPVKT
jgi:prepilin-type N-terminal cleavage/methylation domain-containing protein